MSDREPVPGEIITASTVDVLATVTANGHTVSSLISAWLGSFADSSDTRNAYARDLKEYVDWCVRRDLDPLTVHLPEVQMYSTELASAVNPRTQRGYAASTRARKLAAVSSWYTFLVRAGAITANPARDVARPRYDRHHSPTATVTLPQASAMLSASRDTGHRTLGHAGATVAMLLLIDLGIRVSELCRCDLADMGHREGHRVLTVRMKGGRVRTRPLPPTIAHAVDEYLTQRPSHADRDALLVTQDGSRVNRHQIYRLVQRMATEAGIPAPKNITPHSMRHAFNTIAREHGAALEDRRDALGHASASVTQLYDHVALSLTRDPAHVVASATDTTAHADNPTSETRSASTTDDY